MTREQADLHAISFWASAVIAMLGLTHEVVGPTLFPWAPAWFGAFFWHAIGIGALLLGLACLATVMGKLRLPLVPIGIATGIGGIGAIALMVIKAGEFHYFAAWLVVAGFALANAQRRMARQPAEI